jgi:hypothetical protein
MHLWSNHKPWQRHIQQEKDAFHQLIGLTFNEDISEVLHFEHSFVGR